MTIGLSANALRPADAGGQVDGIGTYTAALEHELQTLGIATRRVYAPVLRSHGFAPVPRGELGFAQPVPAAVLASNLLHFPMLGARQVEAAITIYHATDYLVPPLRGTPIVATLHDAIPHANPQWATRRLRWLKNWIRRAGIAKADIVIAISNAMVPEIEEHYGIPRARIRVVPLGVDKSFCETLPRERVDAVLDRYDLHRGYLFFVGTLQPRKNVAGLLAAYDRLPPRIRAARQLVVAGRYGWGEKALAAELRRRTLGGRCVWLEHVDNEALRYLYAGAGAFVFPSLAEGFGLPVLEALGAGLPVVASDLPSLREVGASFVDYVRPLDTDALTAAMELALEVADEAAVGGRRAYARSFTWAATAAGTLKVYRELL
ncbi:MAG: glycosyltransferase family 1 protein [Betaproteobacteria bacterium]